MTFHPISNHLHHPLLSNSNSSQLTTPKIATNKKKAEEIAERHKRRKEGGSKNNKKEEEDMSVASSIPSIKPPICSSTSPSSSSPTPAASPSSLRCFSATTIRSSQADGPIRRPVAPPLRQPASPLKPPPTPKPAPSFGAVDKSVVTLEFQRQMAKELQEYFKQKKIEEADVGPFFGFLAKNEISNGRWAMFGFAVGMLTEYATGSDFVEQVKILFSNFGILDLD